MNENKNLSEYEVSIVNDLVTDFYYSQKEAMSIVKGYCSVIRRIGLFENTKEWAIKLDEAMKYHITPDMWLNVL